MDIQTISIYRWSAWHVLAWGHIDWIFSFSILEHIRHTAYDTIWFAAPLMGCIVVYRTVDICDIVISYRGKISVSCHHYSGLLPTLWTCPKHNCNTSHAVIKTYPLYQTAYAHAPLLHAILTTHCISSCLWFSVTGRILCIWYHEYPFYKA